MYWRLISQARESVSFGAISEFQGYETYINEHSSLNKTARSLERNTFLSWKFERQYSYPASTELLR